MDLRQKAGRKPKRGSSPRHAVRLIEPKIDLFDVVAIKRNLQGFSAATEAAVVEIHTFPTLGYDLEVVLPTGRTAGLIFGVLPEDVELVVKNDGSRPSKSPVTK